MLKKIIRTNTLQIFIPENKYRLEKLFFHILDNAIKYNNNKNAVIEIGFKEQTKFWSFYIKDNSNGIEEKYLDKVFEAFQKLEHDNRSIGFWLAVVKKIIDNYNVQIWIEYKPKLDAIFSFNIKK
jgi:light-regulated signal transduction histidine kinase (bacteriophytochrome)